MKKKNEKNYNNTKIEKNIHKITQNPYNLLICVNVNYKSENL